MDALLEQQTWMQTAISKPHPKQTLIEAEHFLQSTAMLPASHRIAIYQRSYRARILQSFHAIFPGLLHALGERTLNAFVLDFIDCQPPSHFSINRIADHFPAYLQRTRPPQQSDSDWIDFLIELAQLELALLQVSESRGMEDMPSPPDDAILHMPENQLLKCRPKHSPCLRLLRSGFPVHLYLQAIRADSKPEMPRSRPSWLALTRIDFRLSTRELAQVQWELLVACDGNTTLAETLSHLAKTGLKPTPTIGLLRIWIGNFLTQGLLFPDFHIAGNNAT